MSLFEARKVWPYFIFTNNSVNCKVRIGLLDFESAATREAAFAISVTLSFRCLGLPAAFERYSAHQGTVRP